MIKKKDRVVVLWGKDRGKEGDVLRVIPQTGRAVVEKINIVKRHAKATREKPGGIQEIEASLPLSKLMLVCPNCKQPNRPKVDYLSDGTKQRACRRCGEMMLPKERTK